MRYFLGVADTYQQSLEEEATRPSTAPSAYVVGKVPAVKPWTPPSWVSKLPKAPSGPSQIPGRSPDKTVQTRQITAPQAPQRTVEGVVATESIRTYREGSGTGVSTKTPITAQVSTTCKMDPKLVTEALAVIVSGNAQRAKEVLKALNLEYARLSQCGASDFGAINSAISQLTAIAEKACRINHDLLVQYTNAVNSGNADFAFRTKQALDSERSRLSACPSALKAIDQMQSSLISSATSFVQQETEKARETATIVGAEKHYARIRALEEQRTHEIIKRASKKWTPQENAELEKARKVAKDLGSFLQCTDSAYRVSNALKAAGLQDLAVTQWRWKGKMFEHSATVVYPKRLSPEFGVVVDNWWLSKSVYSKDERPGGFAYKGAEWAKYDPEVQKETIVAGEIKRRL